MDRKEFSGTCDWCGRESDTLVEHRDFEEGAAGAEYDVCKPCRQKEAAAIDRELSEGL